MGTSPSRIGEYMKLTQDQRALVKQVWIGIENNPQFHGSVFFTGLCELYPQYTKYFTFDCHVPLNFDARTNAKFTVIMETMGYVLLDFHNKPKQLDRIIGYIALIHKDMSLARSDMFNFGISLLEYLSVTFPMSMTPECREIISNYMNNLLTELSHKIEIFKKDEILGNYESSGKTNIPCGSWLLCSDNLIYGQTLDYWRERKKRWDERLDDWKIKEATIIRPTRGSSTDDGEISIIKSKTEDETSEFAESTARLLESHGIPRITKVVTPRQTMVMELRESSEKSSTTRRPSHQASGKHRTIVDEDSTPEIAGSSKMTPREKRRSHLTEISRSHEETTRTVSIPDKETESFLRSSSEPPKSVELQIPLKSQKIDSLARQRRRRTQAQLNAS